MEPYHFDAAPTPEESFDATSAPAALVAPALALVAPAPTHYKTTQLFLKQTFCLV
jgi:hypothetical protein